MHLQLRVDELAAVRRPRRARSPRCAARRGGPPCRPGRTRRISGKRVERLARVGDPPPVGAEAGRGLADPARRHRARLREARAAARLAASRSKRLRSTASAHVFHCACSPAPVTLLHACGRRGTGGNCVACCRAILGIVSSPLCVGQPAQERLAEEVGRLSAPATRRARRSPGPPSGSAPRAPPSRRTIRESGLRPRPKAVRSVSSYVARPSIIHDIAKRVREEERRAAEERAPGAPERRAPPRGGRRGRARGVSTRRSQPSWLPKASLPSGATARIVTSGYGSGEANPFGGRPGRPRSRAGRGRPSGRSAPRAAPGSRRERGGLARHRLVALVEVHRDARRGDRPEVVPRAGRTPRATAAGRGGATAGAQDGGRGASCRAPRSEHAAAAG